MSYLIDLVETVLRFIREHPGLASVLYVILAVFSFLFGHIRALAKHRREMHLYHSRIDLDRVVIKTAVVRQRPGGLRLSIRDWYGRDLLSSVFTPSLVEPLREALANTAGLIRFKDANLQYDLMADACARVAANSHDSNVAFAMGRDDVHQDPAVVMVLSWQRENPHSTVITRDMKRVTILVLAMKSLPVMQKPNFVETIELGKLVTKADAQLVHDMAIRVEAELAKPAGVAAMAEVDLESLKIEELLDEMESRISAKLPASEKAKNDLDVN
jgi:hypothetical protein